MLFRKRIPCYVLIFDQVDIIKQTLSFLTQYANKLDLIIIENPSANTPQIKELVGELGRARLIKRYYLFDQNILANAFDIVLNREHEIIQASRFVLVTDGDLISEKGWLDEELRILRRRRDVFACGVSLDMANLPLASFPSAQDWIPPDMDAHSDYFEAYTGAHLLLFRGNELAGFLNWKNANNGYFIDGEMHRYCYEQVHKKWARTKRSKAYHLTWDLYLDKENSYTRHKVERSFKDTWYHRATASYHSFEY